MNLESLEAIKRELELETLDIKCDGALTVDWHDLLELQTWTTDAASRTPTTKKSCGWPKA